MSATSQTFPGEVVDDGEDAEAPAVAQLVMQKIERPALVRTLRQGQRRPSPERSLAAAATANLQPFLGIEPAQLLMVQQEAFAPQQDMPSAVAEATSDRGALAQPRANDTIIRPPAAIADRAAVHPDRLACLPLAHPADLAEVSGGLSSGGGRDHFLAVTSRRHRVVQHRLGQQFLQPCILVLERLQPSRIRDIHAAIFGLPLVKRRRACGTPPPSLPPPPALAAPQ